MSHDHDHAPSVADAGKHWRKLAIVLAITATVMVVEVIGAIISGSVALLADAAHMLTDVAGLSLALVAALLSRRPVSDQRTWGFRRAEVVAAAAQAAVLLAVGTYVLYEGIGRLFNPEPVASGAMVIFGVIGLLGNAIGIAILAGSRGDNLNTRAAFLEVINDALGSVAVLVAAGFIYWSDFLRADAIASILIGVLIIPRTLRLLRDSIDVLLESTPRGLDLGDVRTRMMDVDHVYGVHDLHATQVATGLPVLTAHVVVREECFHDGHLKSMLDELQNAMESEFDVEHSTIQFECHQHAEHETGAHP
ncbi:cation diffusion facilitator family transporter [Ornithinimicrobium sp. Arc0846-15]|nr:cation diffusion facilitator family transporter [Ornithinimicrobium laminariae]